MNESILICTLLSEILFLFSVSFRELCYSLVVHKEKCFITYPFENSHSCVYIFNYYTLSYGIILQISGDARSFLGNWHFSIKLLKSILLLCTYPAEISFIVFFCPLPCTGNVQRHDINVHLKYLCVSVYFCERAVHCWLVNLDVAIMLLFCLSNTMSEKWPFRILKASWEKPFCIQK